MIILKSSEKDLYPRFHGERGLSPVHVHQTLHRVNQFILSQMFLPLHRISQFRCVLESVKDGVVNHFLEYILLEFLFFTIFNRDS